MIKQNWLRWVIVAIPALMTAFSAVGKLTGAEQVTSGLTAAGLGPNIVGLGLLELIIAALFLVPLTRNIGFFLACSYFGGAMAVQLARNEPFTAPMVVLSLFWVAMALTKPGIFLSPSRA